MATLPEPVSHTVDRIYAALAKPARSGDAETLSLSDLANDCDRAIWNLFRWIAEPEVKDGRRQSIVNTAIIWKERLIFDLRSIWCEISDEETSVEFVYGHVRGKLTAVATGVPEAPVAPHVVLAKSHSLKNFKTLTKHKLEKGKPDHYALCQLFMHARSVDRALYLAVCRDDDARYAERVKYDPVYAARIVARITTVVHAPTPPARLETFACEWCKSKTQCLEGAWSRLNCRTCLHATPNTGGTWKCEKHAKGLSFVDQQSGCPDHRFIPALVPGEQINVLDGDLIEYRLADGSQWIDGMRESV